MQTIWNNRVIFRWGEGVGEQCILLSLDQPFVVRPGLAPNVNTAEVSYLEYDKLGGDPRKTGRVEFWCTGKAEPDAVWDKWSIVEVQALQAARTVAQGEIRTVRYRLHLADRREGFIFPRGGLLWEGEVNGDEGGGSLADEQRLAGEAMPGGDGDSD